MVVGNNNSMKEINEMTLQEQLDKIKADNEEAKKIIDNLHVQVKEFVEVVDKVNKEYQNEQK